jgi:hypothetical protein
MAQKRINVTRGQAQRVRQLERSIGDEYTLRILLSGGKQRLMRPERLQNIKAGTAKLQPWEAERIKQLQVNQSALGRLAKTEGDLSKPQQRQRGKALKDWVTKGKEKETPYDTQNPKQKRKQQRAIKALYFLGVEPDQGHYYVRKVAA